MEDEHFWNKTILDSMGKYSLKLKTIVGMKPIGSLLLATLAVWLKGWQVKGPVYFNLK